MCMSRNPRVDLKKHFYHIINRANARICIFEYKEDYDLFEKTLVESKLRWGVDILSYIIMPNHFHLVLSPHEDGNVAKFMHFFTMTFTQRWHAKNHSIGTGHLFQGRYKSFIVENSDYLLQLLLYVERNALSANLVIRAEDWRWSTLWIRMHGTKDQKKVLSEWPFDSQKNYLNMVNESVSQLESNKIKISILKNIPFGSEDWKNTIIKQHKLQSVLRSPGRPKNGS